MATYSYSRSYGPVSVLVKLQDGSVVRSGGSIPVQEEIPEQIVPDMLTEASPTTPSSPVTASPTDADSSASTAEGNGQIMERNGSVEGPHIEEHATATTPGTATDKTGTRNRSGNS